MIYGTSYILNNLLDEMTLIRGYAYAMINRFYYKSTRLTRSLVYINSIIKEKNNGNLQERFTKAKISCNMHEETKIACGQL